MEWIEFEGRRVPVALRGHDASDDLLTGGLGLGGLQAPLSSPVGDLDEASRRRRALHANWQGIAFLAAPDVWTRSALASPVTGRELHARLESPTAPAHRVMLQIPEHFDPLNPRLLVTAASGSRGIFGATALASAWGLPRGWAVVHTDKGCGTDWFDADTASGPDLLGAPTDDPARQVFRPDASGVAAHSVLIPHAHSQAHPEAHWGEHVRQAMRFGWTVLDTLFAPQRPSGAARRRCVAVGLSNGGAAVLRALEQPAGVDAAVVLAPNVLSPRGGRPFLHYAAEAALWLPLAVEVPEMVDRLDAVRPFAPRPFDALAEDSRRALHALGVRRPTARNAWRFLRRQGWPDRTLGSALLSTAFGFWTAAGHTYTRALSRAAPSESPLGSYFAMLDSASRPRAATAEERALWWSDGAGIVPGAGVGIVEAQPAWQTLATLHRLLRGAERDPRLAAGMAATRCAPPGGAVPVSIIHGQRDGLIPPAFSSLPWARMARAAGARVSVHCPEEAPHFDAFLALPGYNRGLGPLLPHGFAALDRLDATWTSRR